MIPGWGRFPWRRKWQPTPVFLPGKFHGQRSLAGYMPWDHKELDITERLTQNLRLKTSRAKWKVFGTFSVGKAGGVEVSRILLVD